MAVSDLQTAIDRNDAIIAAYASALATDAATPRVNYSIDGESVDFNASRKSIVDAMRDLIKANQELQEQINQRQPYIFRQRHRL